MRRRSDAYQRVHGGSGGSATSLGRPGGSDRVGDERFSGFVSANLHKSLDGTKVANYAQWRSWEDFEAMLEDPEAAVHMREAAEIAKKFEPYLYEVSFIDEAPDS